MKLIDRKEVRTQSLTITFENDEVDLLLAISRFNVSIPGFFPGEKYPTVKNLLDGIRTIIEPERQVSY